MAPPGPYSGTSTLALVARVSALTLGLVYGSTKLSYLKAKAKSHAKAEAKGHHWESQYWNGLDMHADMLKILSFIVDILRFVLSYQIIIFFSNREIGKLRQPRIMSKLWNWFYQNKCTILHHLNLAFLLVGEKFSLFGDSFSLFQHIAKLALNWPEDVAANNIGKYNVFAVITTCIIFVANGISFPCPSLGCQPHWCLIVDWFELSKEIFS